MCLLTTFAGTHYVYAQMDWMVGGVDLSGWLVVTDQSGLSTIRWLTIPVLTKPDVVYLC